MAALPSNVNYGTVTGRFLRAVIDSPDPDRDPDGVPIVGLVIRFSADLSSAIVRNQTALPDPATILIDPITVTTDTDGYLIGPDNTRSIRLIATDDADLDPHDWTYRVRMTNPALPNFPPVEFSFALPTDATIDLSTVVPVPPNPGAGLVAWQAAVAETFQNKVDAELAREGADEAKADAETAASTAGAAAAAAVAPLTAIVTTGRLSPDSISTTISAETGTAVPPLVAAAIASDDTIRLAAENAVAEQIGGVLSTYTDSWGRTYLVVTPGTPPVSPDIETDVYSDTY